MALVYQMQITVSLETFISITGFQDTEGIHDIIITEFH